MEKHRFLGKMEDARLEALMRVFPTKAEYAGFAAASAAAVVEVALGRAPSPLTLAVFAYFAGACLLGGALLAEGERRGMSAEPLGWVENEVRKVGGDDGE